MSGWRARGLVASVAAITGVAMLPAVGLAAEATVVQDEFDLASVDGWQPAPIGGPYIIVGPVADYDVAGGAGTMRLPAASAGREVRLIRPNVRDVDAAIAVRTDKVATGSGQYVYLGGRRQSTAAQYRAMLKFLPNGTVQVQPQRLSPPSEVALAPAVTVPGLTRTTATTVHLRLQAVGANPTTVRVRAWADGEDEPATWHATGTDSTSVLQGRGDIELETYLASGTTNAPVMATFEHLRVTNLDDTPAVTTVSLSPSAPEPDDTLQASSTATDADGDVLTMEYSWLLNGVVESQGSADTHSFAGQAGSGDVVTVIARPLLPGGGYAGPGASAQRTYDPSDTPSAVTVTLTPTSPTHDDRIYAHATVTDPDPDVIQLRYRWSLNGVPFGEEPGQFSMFQLENQAQAGDVLSVEAIPVFANGQPSGPAATASVTYVAGPPIVFYASDTFSRSVQAGWGSAPIGGAYTHSGPATDFFAQSALGTMTLPTAGANRAATLNANPVLDADIRFRIWRNKGPVGAPQYVYGVLRRINSNTELRGKVRFAPNGNVYVQGTAVVGGVETALGPEVQAFQQPNPLNSVDIHVRVTGTNPATVHVSAFAGGTVEPEAWQFTGTSSAPALQAPGGFGVRAYLGSGSTNAPVNVDFNRLQVRNVPSP